MSSTQTVPKLPPSEPFSDHSARIVLIEDDAGDAVLVQALLEETTELWQVEWASSLAKAIPALAKPASCILVDLGLPDAFGFEALTQVLEMAGDAAVIVLTGLDDEKRGLEAVASGAQDYLVKGSIDALTLSRAIRYAIERKLAQETARRLREANIQRRENERLERGLLPTPLLRTHSFDLATRYRPGGGRIQLGGDFFDVVELASGVTRLIIGDVSGHGPDEAAVGVVMRAAWRALVLSGQSPHDVLTSLQTLLESERHHDEVFVTCCDITLDPQKGEAILTVAGHPPPVVLNGSGAHSPATKAGPALGIVDDAQWPTTSISLRQNWELLIFTDGLLEGHRINSSERLGIEGLLDIINQTKRTTGDAQEFVDSVVNAVEIQNGRPLADDLAVIHVTGLLK